MAIASQFKFLFSTDNFKCTVICCALLSILFTNSSIAELPSNQKIQKLNNGWIRSVGEAALIDITPEQARRKALEEARRQAIAYAIGIDINSHQIVKTWEDREGVFDSFLLISEHTSSGRIVQENVIEWKNYEIAGKPFPVTIYSVEIEVKVDEEKGNSDPSFNIKLFLNSDNFTRGDDIRIGVTSTKRCFVTVMNITAEDTVLILFPYKYRPNSVLVPGDTLWIPDEHELSMGIRYKAFLPSGRSNVSELIKVVATKDSLAFETPLMGYSGPYKIVATPKTALSELMKWMVQIPRSSRAEDQRVYTITH